MRETDKIKIFKINQEKRTAMEKRSYSRFFFHGKILIYPNILGGSSNLLLSSDSNPTPIYENQKLNANRDR